MPLILYEDETALIQFLENNSPYHAWMITLYNTSIDQMLAIPVTFI
jgi:hypothetical protein